MTPDPPENWTEVETNYPFQENRWENEESGNFLVIEGKSEPWHDEDAAPLLNVSLISEKFSERPDPIRTVVEDAEEYELALRRAFEYMEMHPEGGT